uniref:Uncharacterized protein n=1 Tax=Oncorhynchus tshawytscha TaxID=74940 RepID=A0AAZ3Q304_ONCTS
ILLLLLNYFQAQEKELVVCANELQPLDEEQFRIAERCKSLSTIGFMSIMEEVQVPDDDYSDIEQIHTEVSKHLGRMWYPVMMPTW